MSSRSKKFAVALGILATGGLLAACSGGSTTPAATGASVESDAPVSITYVAYGGVGQDSQIKAFQEPYTAEHPNVSFVNTSPADVAQVKAQVLAGAPQWDVVAVAPYAAAQNCGTLFEKLDVPDLDPADFPKGAIGDCYVGNFTNGPVFGYNADKWPDPATAPKTVEDYFDTAKFPGKRGVVATLQDGMMEYPLLADGVDPDDLYPLDVDRALAKWDTIRDDTMFAPNVGALQQAVASDQVDMFFLVESRQLALLDGGTNIKPVWDKTVAAMNALAVPLGSPKKEAAEDFLQFLVQPEPSATMAELGGVSPINLNSKPNLSPHGQLVDIFGTGNTGVVVNQDVDWYAENYNTVQPVLTNWLNG